MRDGFQRDISYLRLSVTDRCNFRCRYCLDEDAVFRPRSETLTLDELDRLARVFIGLGIRKIRITGGEPLVRSDTLPLIERLGRTLGKGSLRELTMTTNGFLLSRHADRLAAAGMRRVNVSLDSLDRARFAAITRRDALDRVISGISTAQLAGLKVKVNCVVQKGINYQDVPDLLRWCVGQGLDLTLIETMPIGVEAAQAAERYLPLSEVMENLKQTWTLLPDLHKTGGPARFYRVADSDSRLGLITPLSHNFCGTCNRIRVTAAGRLYTCLGREGHVDLRDVMRSSEDDRVLAQEIQRALGMKPADHGNFMDTRSAQDQLARSMAMTGG